MLERRGGTRARGSRRDSTARRSISTGRPTRARCCFSVEDRGRIGLWRLRARRRDAPTRLAPGGAIAGFARSADGSVLVVRAVVGDASAGARLPRAATAAASAPIETLNRALLARHAFGDVREFTIKGWRGEPVQMFVTYPPNFDPTKKWPLMHSIHGGPHAAHLDGWHFRWNAHVFAGQGYVVAGGQLPRLVGLRAEVPRDRSPARYGEGVRRYRGAATDFLLRQGYIDRERLAATGGSYGGFMVAYMNGHTDRYKRVCLSRRLLRLGQHDGDRRLPRFSPRSWARSTGKTNARVLQQSPHHYVQARARRRRWSCTASSITACRRRRRCSTTTRCKPKGVPRAAAVLPRREPLDPEAAELASAGTAEFFAWLVALRAARRGRTSEDTRRRTSRVHRRLVSRRSPRLRRLLAARRSASPPDTRQAGRKGFRRRNRRSRRSCRR